jgi:hypothetical protein
MAGQFRLLMILTGSVSLAATLFDEAASAQGQERDEPPGWSFTVAPYFWAAGIEGDVGVGDRQAEIDVDFSEIRENLKFGAMMLAEARKDRYGIFSLLFSSVLEMTPMQGPSIWMSPAMSRWWAGVHSFGLRSGT